MKIDIWTDGSYKKKQGGCSFYIVPYDESPTLAYFHIKNIKSSTNAELISIIEALKYLFYLKQDLTLYHVNIFTDVANIVLCMNKKMYKEWNKKFWKKDNGSPIKSNVCEWFQLSCFVESIPNIKFIKASYKEDSNNKLVHKYCNYSRALENQNITFLRWSEIDNNFIKIIDNTEMNEILQYKTPWEYMRNVNNKLNLANYKNIEYVNTNKIFLNEDKYLNCNIIKLDGMLKEIKKDGISNIRVVVTKQDDRYVLVYGIAALVAAKLLNIQSIPCKIVSCIWDNFVIENLLKKEAFNKIALPVDIGQN